MDSYVEVDPAAIRLGAEAQGALVLANAISIGGEPVVVGDDQTGFSTVQFGEFAVFYGAIAFFFGPEINAVYIPMRKPQRAMVGVVGFLLWIVFCHGIGPGHGFAGLSDDGPQDRFASGIDQVFGE